MWPHFQRVHWVNLQCSSNVGGYSTERVWYTSLCRFECLTKGYWDKKKQKTKQNRQHIHRLSLTTSVSALAKTSVWRPAFRPTHFWLVWMWVYDKRVLFSEMGSCPADLIFLWSIKSKHFISSNYYMALHIPTWVMCLTKRVCERGP